MRWLFVCIPEAGHVHPLIPLAQAAAAAGHDVRFATGQPMHDRITRAGFAVERIDPDTFEAAWETLAQQVGGTPGEGLAPDDVTAWFAPHLFAGVIAPLMLESLIAVIQRWQPHLVVHDTLAFAGAIAAAAARIPSVQHPFGLLLAEQVYRSVEAPLEPVWRAAGIPAEPYGGSFRNICLSMVPAALEVPLPADMVKHLRQIQPVGFSAIAGEDLPGWVRALPERPTIYLTLDTYLNNDRSVFRAALDGLATEPVNVVATVGRNHAPDWLDPVPANARVAQYIPQSTLLPHCALLVSHGGAGTLLPSLGAGLPQVVLPQGADNFDNAHRVEASGVGKVIWPGHVTPEAVRLAVRAVLDDTSYRVAAGKLAAEMAAMPSPAAVVRELAALV
jgi:UDP:flavonoid glycosyltransferase YjiC (YdhE family)